MSIQIQSRTLQIQANGTGRLSPDLARMGDKFSWITDRRKKKLSLMPLSPTERDGSTLKAWKAGIRAQSKMIALKSILAILGLDAAKLKGQVYDVKVKGKVLEVQF